MSSHPSTPQPTTGATIAPNVRNTYGFSRPLVSLSLDGVATQRQTTSPCRIHTASKCGITRPLCNLQGRVGLPQLHPASKHTAAAQKPNKRASNASPDECANAQGVVAVARHHSLQPLYAANQGLLPINTFQNTLAAIPICSLYSAPLRKRTTLQLLAEAPYRGTGLPTAAIPLAKAWEPKSPWLWLHGICSRAAIGLNAATLLQQRV